jgi:hypothetical protein
MVKNGANIQNKELFFNNPLPIGDTPIHLILIINIYAIGPDIIAILNKFLEYVSKRLI